MLSICFCPGKYVCYDKEYYNSKSDCFRDENIREIRNKGFPEHGKKIIRRIFRDTLGESPSKQWPKETYRLCPHDIFHQMKERSSGHKEQTCIPVALIEIKTHESKKKNEYKSMGDKAAVCKRISEEHSSDQLIYNIRKYGSKYHIPVIGPAADTGHKISEDGKQSNCDSEVPEKKHGIFTCFMIQKHFRCRQPIILLCGGI